MQHLDARDLEIQALRERLSRLSQASLRINESLEFDTVLQGVLDAARSLTDARYGVMTLHGDGGEVETFLASGMSPEQASAVWNLPVASGVYQRLGCIPGTVRHPDLSELLSEMGVPGVRFPLSAGMVYSFLASPLLHRDQRLGNIYLASKLSRPEFTQEDEETLVMFASQAALVIANSRRYRDEQRARDDLETLINTSPVGVVVFDARTGVLKSSNREARRIAESLCNPDQAPEDLLGVITMRRTDGREVSLREFPIAGLLSIAETVRAEEIVLGVPDGRSVTVLLNATPIPSDGGVRGVRGGHRSGHGRRGGTGASAGRFSGHGEPRTEGTTHLHQGFCGQLERVPGFLGQGGGAPVYPHHRVSVRPDEGPN